MYYDLYFRFNLVRFRRKRSLTTWSSVDATTGITSFIFLIKGADFFIETCAKLAKKLGVSEFVIGLTVTAIGTSLPELASSLSAGAQGATGIVIGNVVGSNIANNRSMQVESNKM